MTSPDFTRSIWFLTALAFVLTYGCCYVAELRFGGVW
jgi:hypothetical protein